MNVKKTSILLLLFLAGAMLLSAANEGKTEHFFSLSPEKVQSEIKSLKKQEKERKNEPAYQRTMGLLYYVQAAGGKKSAEKAIKWFEKYLNSTDDQLIKAYLGTCYTIYGGDTLNLAYVSKGYAIVDEACEAAPDNYQVLATRINGALGAPAFLFMKRKELVNKDLVHLQELFAKQKITGEQHAGTLVMLAEVFLKEKENGQARELLEKIVKEYPANEDAKKLLQGLE